MQLGYLDHMMIARKLSTQIGARWRAAYVLSLGPHNPGSAWRQSPDYQILAAITVPVLVSSAGPLE